ncbi:MAG TPA: hypothetical protein VMI75_14305 [Polyangiaceae bacterium]|nr:hypothetical protein [Polyangiaceae bacterium]
MVGKLVSHFDTATGREHATAAPADAAQPEQPLRPPSAATALAPGPEKETWPPSVSRDAPEKLSTETRAHAFFVRTKRREILSTIGVLELLAKCPVAEDSEGREGVMIHRDVLFSLGYHLLDVVHELENARRGQRDEGPRYDERMSKALDQLGLRDAEIKELRAALGEAAIKIRRLESKLFK